MKKIVISLIVLVSLSFFLPLSFWETNSVPSEKYSALQNQIDTIFVTLETKLEKKDIGTKKTFYTTLIERVTKIQKSGKKYSDKNMFILEYILEKSQQSLKNLEENELSFSEIFWEEIVENTDSPEEQDSEIISFSESSYTTNSEKAEVRFGKFTLSEKTRLQWLKLYITSDSEISFLSNIQKIKIVEQGSNINIALSDSMEFADDRGMGIYVYFTSSTLIKEWAYEFVGNMVSDKNNSYTSYLRHFTLYNEKQDFGAPGIKIATVQVEHTPQAEQDVQAGIQKQTLKVPELGSVIGSFKIYGDQFYFKKLQLRVTPNKKSSIYKQKVYITDVNWEIIAENSGYETEELEDTLYITFSNLILNDWIYGISVTQLTGSDTITQVETRIGDYILENKKAFFKDNHFKDTVISVLEIQ